jgi:hypothetical protein
MAGYGNDGWEGLVVRSRSPRVLSVCLFLVGVAISAVVNVVTTIMSPAPISSVGKWILTALLIVLSAAGAWLAWRTSQAADDPPVAKSGASTYQEIGTSYGPVIGQISGGDVSFGDSRTAIDRRSDEKLT